MESKGIIRNVSLLLASDIIGKGLSFILVVAIARYLGDAGLGKYSFAFAFAGLFAIFADLGLTTYLTKEIAKNKDKAKKYASNLITMKMLLAAVTLILPIIVINFIEKSEEVKTAVYIVSIATSMLNFSSSFGTLFAAYEKLQYQALINIIERLVTVGLGLLMLSKGAGLIGLVIAYMISYFSIMIIAALISYNKTTRFTLELDTKLWGDMLKKSMPFWFTTIFITIYFRIDTVLLQMMTTYEAVGWYNAAYKALDALYFIPGAVITAIFPVMSRFHSSNPRMLRELYKKAFNYLLILAIPIATGITLLSDRIVSLIYSGKFAEAAPALQILIWAEAIIFVSAISGYLLNAINKQLTFTIITGLAAILNIIINLILIPKYSYLGAAIATVATELIVLVLLFDQAQKSGYRISILRTLIKPTIAALAMTALILMIKQQNIIVIIPAAAITYFAILLLIKGIGKEDIEMFIKLP
ncbi:flippase [Candidatus Woesearchaeota archaeon]|nr:flippase [Candidatus Woesearchaeota archaeon]